MENERSRGRWKTLPKGRLVLVVIAGFFLAAVLAGCTFCKLQKIDPEAEFADVIIWEDHQGNLIVHPDTVWIRPAHGKRTGPHRVRWKIDPDAVPEGGEVVIEFRREFKHSGDADKIKGPFEKGKDEGKDRGRYTKKKNGLMEILSERVDVKVNPSRKKFWKYDVVVLDADKEVVHRIDPGVAIEEDD